MGVHARMTRGVSWLAVLLGAVGSILLLLAALVATQPSDPHPQGAPASPSTSSTSTPASPQPSTTQTPDPISTGVPALPTKEPSPPATISPVIPAASAPLSITYSRLGWVDTPLPRLAPDANGTSVTPPIDTSNYDVTFRPYWLTVSAPAGAGSLGPTVITGHSCESDCKPSWLAFNHLNTAQAGDVVTIRTANGQVDYRVTKAVSYGRTELANAAEVWGTQQSPAGEQLRLIACDPSNFDGRNMVVFATLVK